MPSKSVEDCCKLLADKKLTIAFAESATVGRFAAEFGLSEGAGKILKGGIVCYDACIKEDLLQVSETLVQEFTPESAEVTKAAAYGLRKLIPADIHIAVTGLTSAGGSETLEKPVGTMFVHCVSDAFEFADRTVFTGNKEEVILKCIDHISELLIQKINEA
jgi:nicotinamide-nucleotide amidase